MHVVHVVSCTVGCITFDPEYRSDIAVLPDSVVLKEELEEGNFMDQLCGFKICLVALCLLR